MDIWSNFSISSTPLTRQSSEYSLNIEDDSSPILDNAIKNIDLILSNQTKALNYLTIEYQKSEFTINQMKKSLRLLNNSLKLGGKIIISGMGKSYKIASKTVATLNSLKMHSAILHPSEALHGDLGIIREDHNDSIILISASGNSPELLQMLEHISINISIILMTCNKNSTLSKHPKINSLLLAEIPSNLTEVNLYGLSAPTISTTLCLTLLDAVSIALSEIHINDFKIRKNMFTVNHPGGAIGINYKLEKLQNNEKEIKSDNKGDNKGDDNKYGNNNLDNEYFNLNRLVLKKKVENSRYKQEVESLPLDEDEFLKLITLNDFVIVKSKEDNQDKVLECETAKLIYRENCAKGANWQQILLAIEKESV